jgi:hypothetical protein
VTALFVVWKGANGFNTLCALLPRMNEPMIERPTLYDGGHIVNEVSVNVTCMCVCCSFEAVGFNIHVIVVNV